MVNLLVLRLDTNRRSMGKFFNIIKAIDGWLFPSACMVCGIAFAHHRRPRCPVDNDKRFLL